MYSERKSTEKPSCQSEKIRVWDLPVRIVHWLITFGVFFSWITAKNSKMEWHLWSGYMIFGLVVFRIYWGFWGSKTARFSDFLRSPLSVRRYLSQMLCKSNEPAIVGHNPLGGWSALVMILLLLVQSGLGLFSVDVDGLDSGPLAEYVSFSAGRRIAEWHELVFNVLLSFIILHIVAIFFYLLVKKDNLLLPMLTGKKLLPKGEYVAPFSLFSWRTILGVFISGLSVTAILTNFQF